MGFTGSEGSTITLTQAAALTANYRDANPDAILGHFMGKGLLENILAQEGCMGIRTYYGLDTEGTRQIVMVGANEDEEDMTDGIIADVTVLCPTRCGSTNTLNSD